MTKPVWILLGLVALETVLAIAAVAALVLSMDVLATVLELGAAAR